MTANQARDAILEHLTDKGEIQAVKNRARESNDERKADPETYSRCPRCYGYHGIHDNFDNLCDQCQQTILKHFPDHESVPHIRAALAQW